MNNNQFNPNTLKLIEGDDKIRAKKCLQKINNALTQYDCEVHPTVLMTPIGNEFAWSVFPKPRQIKQ